MSAPSPEPTPAAPQGKQRRQIESDRKRERILDATEACLAELGRGGATVTEIARRAEVSNGLLYQFFRNKDALLASVLERVVRAWVREMVPRAGERPAEALEGMFRRSVAFCRSHPLLPALLRGDASLQLSSGGPTGRERVDAHRALVARLLGEGIACGDFRSDLDVDATADVICQLQSDYSGRAYRDDERFPDDPQIIEAAIGLIRRAVASEVREAREVRDG